MDGAILKPIGTGGVSRQLRPLQQPGGDRGAEGSTPTPPTTRPAPPPWTRSQKIMVEQMPMIPTSARQRRRRVQHEELGRLAGRRRTRTRRRSRPSRTRCDVVLHLKPASQSSDAPAAAAARAGPARHRRPTAPRQEPGMTLTDDRGHRPTRWCSRPTASPSTSPYAGSGRDLLSRERTGRPRGRRRRPDPAPGPGDRAGRRVRLGQVDRRPAAGPAVPAHRRRHPAARRVGHGPRRPARSARTAGGSR